MAGVWQYELCDRANNVVADITSIAFNKTLSVELNRPSIATCEVPSEFALVNSNYDGDPNVSAGTRCLKVRRNGVIQFNGIVWSLGDTGDANTARTLVTAQDPLVWLPQRLVQDGTGSTVNLSFGSPVSGPDMIQQAVRNTISFDGTVGLDTDTGSFDIDGLDLSAQLTDWPIPLDDLIKLLTDTGAVDVYVSPVDVGDGFAPDIMGRLNAVIKAGVDQPTIHFDYATGDHTVQSVTRTMDMDTLCNKLEYYLGPKISDTPVTRWKGGITATAPHIGGTWPSAFTAAIAASRAKYGVFRAISIYDDTGIESDTRPLFENLYQTELTARLNPRELLNVVPVKDPPFMPAIELGDFGLGDVIRLNVGATLRSAISNASQRVIGFDIAIDDNGGETITRLLTSADQ